MYFTLLGSRLASAGKLLTVDVSDNDKPFIAEGGICAVGIAEKEFVGAEGATTGAGLLIEPI